jgi:hypothetical protein
MTLTIISSQTMTLARKLKAFGLQIDPSTQYVLGGQKTLFDYSAMGDSISTGGVIKNLIRGGVNGSPNANITSIQSSKGIKKESGNFWHNLGSPFNVNSYTNLGSNAPSVVLSFWLKHETATTNSAGLLGYAFQTGPNNQYSLQVTTDPGSPRIRFACAGEALTYNVSIATNTPILYTIYFKATGASTMIVYFYAGDTLVGQLNKAYPLPNPLLGDADQFPRLGAPGGFGGSYVGIMQRAIALQVDPSVFDIDAWLNDEILYNTTRLS